MIAGRYELEELVGTGGMSSVYRANDRQLERPVALKLLHERLGADDEHVTRFRHEAESVARLSHPNIVPVMDRGVDDGRQYIVFEYVDGESLRQLLDREGPLRVRRALEIAIAVADGLAFAHDHGIVHRDVKPQNVLISRDGEIKVTDFGIARSADSGLTQTGTVLGTSNYLSPEQAGGQQVTAAADVYSLGVVLYELLAGDVPFPGGNQVVVALRHATEAPPPLPRGVPPRLAAAVTRALAKDPARRFASMADFAAELRACLAEPLPPPEPTPRVSHRHAPQPPAARRRAARARRRSDRSSSCSCSPAARRAGATHPARAARTTVTLRGIAGYDPAGTDGEHDVDAPKATDGKLATFWQTETYATPDFGNLKSGVGLVLDAGSSVKLRALTVATNTPGYTARILAGDSPSGPFDDDSTDRDRRRVDDVPPERRDARATTSSGSRCSRRATSRT